MKPDAERVGRQLKRLAEDEAPRGWAPGLVVHYQH